MLRSGGMHKGCGCVSKSLRPRRRTSGDVVKKSVPVEEFNWDMHVRKLSKEASWGEAFRVSGAGLPWLGH
jgi:hypothetical protein